jgi:hypothetical protein
MDNTNAAKKRIPVIAIALLLAMSFLCQTPAFGLEKGEVKKTVKSMRGTYYTGSRGAGGTLKLGKDVSLNRGFMRKHGISFGDVVYIKANKKAWTGYWRVQDTGCAGNTIDMAISGSAASRTGIRSYGVFKAKIKVIKKKYQKKYRKVWKKRKAVS